LLDYRLGHLRGGPVELPGAAGSDLVIDGLVCLSDPELEDGMVSHELVDRTLWLREQDGLEDGFVYLAGTFYDVVFLADCRGPDPGAMYQFEPYPGPDHPDPRYTRVTETVGAFLALLEPRTWPLAGA
jgi:hypothetical protein